MKKEKKKEMKKRIVKSSLFTIPFPLPLFSTFPHSLSPTKLITLFFKKSIIFNSLPTITSEVQGGEVCLRQHLRYLLCSFISNLVIWKNEKKNEKEMKKKNCQIITFHYPLSSPTLLHIPPLP